MSQIKNEKYMSLKEIDDAVANPNFGENIVIDINYHVNPNSSLFQSSYPDLSTVSNTNSRYHSQVCTVTSQNIYTGQSIYTGNRSYLDESLYLDYNNYNLKPPVYAVPIPPVYRVQSLEPVLLPVQSPIETLELANRLTVPIPSLVIDSIDSIANNTGYKETHFLKLASRQTLKIGSNVLIKKTYNQYKICINNKGTVKKIFKKNNGHWYFFVEIEKEEIKKQITQLHHYLEKNNDKKFKYPFFKDINIVQEKSWIVIQNKTENFELIESNNKSTIVLPASKPTTSQVSTSTSSYVTPHVTPLAYKSAAYFANVNAEIIAAEAISARLKAKSDAFLNVFNASVASSASPASSASSASSASLASLASSASPISKKQKI
jgi:hypothetical protein